MFIRSTCPSDLWQNVTVENLIRWVIAPQLYQFIVSLTVHRSLKKKLEEEKLRPEHVGDACH